MSSTQKPGSRSCGSPRSSSGLSGRGTKPGAARQNGITAAAAGAPGTTRKLRTTVGSAARPRSRAAAEIADASSTSRRLIPYPSSPLVRRRTVTPVERTSTSGTCSSTPGRAPIAATSRADSATDDVRKNAVAPSPRTRQSAVPSAAWNSLGLIPSSMISTSRGLCGGPARRIHGRREDGPEHRLGEPARERVLLARVVRADHRVAGDARRRAVPEPRTRPCVLAGQRGNGPERRLPGDRAEGDEHPDPLEESELPGEKWLA